MADNPGATWQPDRPNDLARSQRLRNLLSSDRHGSGSDEQRIALDAFNQEMSDRAVAELMPGLERRRRDLDTHLQEHDAPTVSDGPPLSSSPSSLVRSRRRAFRPSQRLQRHRDGHNQALRPDFPDTPTQGEATPPTIHTGNATGDYIAAEGLANRDQRYRAKRRKLDDGTFDDETKVFSYGDKGRVTPGELKLEIIDCEREYPGSPTRVPQNVLNNDRSIYSTKSNRCSLLLKHVGGMPFSLTKIVFKAPKEGHEPRVQEGMVFVAMDDEKLMENTAQYEARYSAKNHGHHHYPRRYHDLYRPSQEYLQSSRPPSASVDRTRYLRDPYGTSPWSPYGESNSDLDSSLVPGFDVSYSDPSDSEETSNPVQARSPYRQRDYDAEYTQRSYADRYRPQYTANEPPYVNLSASSSESEDDDSYHNYGQDNDRDLREAITRQRRVLERMRAARPPLDNDHYTFHTDGRRHGEEWRDLQDYIPARRSTPSRAELRHDVNWTANHVDSTGSGGSSATKPVPEMSSRHAGSPSETISPHARFSIRRTKTAVAVNFNPPVAGRASLHMGMEAQDSFPPSSYDD